MILSIIIPCFNEQKTLNKIFDKIQNFKELEKEIIIIDDCSSDGTPNVIKELVEKNDNVKSS